MAHSDVAARGHAPAGPAQDAGHEGARARDRAQDGGGDQARRVVRDPEKETVEKPFGWVFFYEPRAAATDPSAVVPGAGPLVVHRDGSTTFLSSSVPPDTAIAEYEKVWAKKSRP